jgi:hypothetical protein
MIKSVAGPMTAADAREDDITNNDISRSSFLQFVFLDYRILYYAKRLSQYGVSVTDPYRIMIDGYNTQSEHMRKEKDKILHNIDEYQHLVNEERAKHHLNDEDKNKKEELNKNIKNKVDQFSKDADKLMNEELAKHHVKDKVKPHELEKVKKTIQEIRDANANNNMENIKTKMEEGTKNIREAITLEEIRAYAEYRIAVFAQDLFSYILLYPNVFREFKDMQKQPDWNRNGKTLENYLSEELERVTGRPVEFEIIDLFLSIIDKGGSLEEEKINDLTYEDYLRKVLISEEWKIDIEETLEKLSEASGLTQTLEKLFTLAYENDVLVEDDEFQIVPAIDVGILTNINVVWDSVFDSRAAVPELVYFLGAYIPIISQRFASCQPSPNQKDYFYDQLKKVEKYLDDAISKETITELQSLQEDPISSKVLTFFRSLGRTVNDPLKLPTERRRQFLYIIWWSLTKDNELSELYNEIVKPGDPGRPPGVNPSALFPGSLVEGGRSDGRFGTASLEQRFKYHQTSAKSFKEKLKQPGGLVTTLERLRGYAI